MIELHRKQTTFLPIAKYGLNPGDAKRDDFDIDEDDAQITDDGEDYKDDETAGDEGVDDGYKP